MPYAASDGNHFSDSVCGFFGCHLYGGKRDLLCRIGKGGEWMQEIYGWVINIVYYMIFVTMLVNLLPGGKYEKYLKLFSGCILILLVIQPVTGGLRLEEKMAAAFKTLSFENDAMELKEDLENMEGRRLEDLISRYEEAAEADISRMASLAGYQEQSVSVKIEDAQDSPDFGRMKHISLVLTEEPAKDDAQEAGAEGTAVTENVQNRSGQNGEIGAAGQAEQIERVETVEPVKIEVGREGSAPSSFAVSAQGKAEPEQVKSLKKEIAGYYQVEEQYVEIKLENE